MNWSRVLSHEEIEKVHQTSMELLGTTGIRFPEPDAIKVFEKHGLKTDGQIVYFRESQVMKALETAPSQFTLHARNPARSVRFGDGKALFAPAYGAPFVIEPQGGRRPATMDDYHNLARLAHALPHQDLSGHLMVEPGDVPANSAHLHMLHASMLHSDKPFIGSVEGKRAAQHTMEMAAILFGAHPDKPVTIGLINPFSPLGYSREMVQALLAYARAGQPVVVATLVMAGSTGPITLAGVLAQQSAEVLAGIVLAQLVNPGVPTVYGSTSTNIEMKTGSLAIGSPELSLIVCASAQIARHYGLPSRAGGALTDAKTPDAQAGFESMFGLLTAVNSGVDFVLHSAGVLNSFLAFSYEKFVLDDELCGMVRRYRRGIEVDCDTLAFDVITRVAHGGNFLLQEHTVERCRTEFWQPVVCDRRGWEPWVEAGRPDAVAHARQRWGILLSQHEDPPLDETTKRQLQAYVDEREP